MRAIKNIRFKYYDYSLDGYYYVTICTNYFKPYLIDKNSLIATEIIDSLHEKIPGVKIDYYIVMPTHVHIIFIFENCKSILGEIVRKLKSLISFACKMKLWQPNYYEHVIRNEIELLKIREYIQNNPLKREIDFEELLEEKE